MKVTIDPDDLWTVAEIGAAFGTSSQTISNWKRRGHMPEPSLVLGGVAYYTSEQVLQIAKNRNVNLLETAKKLAALLSRLEK